jgi:protein phosphatase
MRYTFGVFSDRGKIRDNNEDYCEVNVNSERAFAIVADGMGGHQAGEVASQKAVNLLSEKLNAIHSWSEFESIEEQCEQMVDEINAELYQLAQEVCELEGMGTTLTFIILHDTQAIIGHIGDSRCYIITSTSFKQLTKDHSWVQEMFDKGELTLDEMREHPHKNMITRAIATDERVVLDHYLISLCEDDTFLLCSDGLTNSLSDEEIHQIIRERSDISATADRLGKAALEAGGTDNITVVLIQREAETVGKQDD